MCVCLDESMRIMIVTLDRSTHSVCILMKVRTVCAF